MSEPSQLVDLMKFANEGKPVDFENAFQSVIAQKAVDALQQHKIELTQQIFNDDVVKDEVDVESDADESQDTEETESTDDIDSGVADENT